MIVLAISFGVTAVIYALVCILTNTGGIEDGTRQEVQ